MTVRQLIEVLQKVEDQDLRIMVSGYEGGFNDLETQANNIRFMTLDVNNKWYYGSHEVVTRFDTGFEHQIVKAIIL
jgi:hypothetical protein